MDKLAYHYNKKKLPAKTEGKYLYYYPCEDMENEDAIEKEKTEYLSKASDQELAWFNQNYANAVPLAISTYLKVIFLLYPLLHL